MKRRDRDVQRTKLYRAEDSAFSEMHDEKFNKDQSVDFIQCVLYSDYWKKCKGFKAISIKFRNGGDRACYYHKGKFITAPPWARNEFVLIHELAHSLTAKEDITLAYHGRVFCNHYLNLIRELLGESKAEDLEISFLEYGVRY